MCLYIPTFLGVTLSDGVTYCIEHQVRAALLDIISRILLSHDVTTCVVGGYTVQSLLPVDLLRRPSISIAICEGALTCT